MVPGESALDSRGALPSGEGQGWRRAREELPVVESRGGALQPGSKGGMSLQATTRVGAALEKI